MFFSRNSLCGFFTCFILVCGSALPVSGVDLTVVERWLATNTNVATLKIDFTQTRSMRTLKVPASQSGSLWLDNRSKIFRWQTGDPPQTIVVRHGEEIFIIRTPMKRFERRPFGSGSDGAPGMSALAEGFPRTMDEFHERYRVLRITQEDQIHRIITKPLGAAARGLETFTFVVGQDDYRLRGMEMTLEDGSSVNTVFTRVVPNVDIPPGHFQPDLTGYREGTFQE